MQLHVHVCWVWQLMLVYVDGSNWFALSWRYIVCILDESIMRVFQACNLFVSVCSSISEAPSSHIYSLSLSQEHTIVPDPLCCLLQAAGQYCITVTHHYNHVIVYLTIYNDRHSQSLWFSLNGNANMILITALKKKEIGRLI